MAFDLFMLYDSFEDKVPRNWIKFGGEELMKKVREIVSDIIKRGYTKQEIAKTISSELGVSSITISRELWEILNNRWTGREYYIPIPVLYQLMKLWQPRQFENKKFEVINLVERLVSNSSRSIPVKAVKNLSTDLSKIAGAHAADGTLSKFKTSKNSSNYLWRVVDGDEDSLKALKLWIKNIFDISAKIKKSAYDNSYIIEIRNKVIFRYLNKMFEFKIGDKTSTVSIPYIIENSSLDNRRNFALGVMTFDGCVDAYGYVRLGVRSKKLRNVIVNLMREDSIDVRIDKSRKNEFSFRVNIFKNNTKILDYFAKNTIQWYRAKLFIDNLNTKNIFELFKGNKNNKITLERVLETSKKLNIFDINLLIGQLGVSKRTLRAYLRILEKSNFIEINRDHHKLTYMYKNENHLHRV